MTEILVDQPTSAPTKKIAAVGVAGLVTPIVAAALVQVLDLTEACGSEAGLAITVLGIGFAQGAIAFFSGYFKRNAVQSV